MKGHREETQGTGNSGGREAQKGHWKSVTVGATLVPALFPSLSAV